jgi:hypothetical protein
MSEQVIPNQTRTNQSGANSGAIAESIGEQLSALMDGELARDQIRFLLRGVEAESDLARRWSSYHVISATLKHEYVALTLPANFADGVIGRLEVQSGVGLNPAARRRMGGAMRWVGGGAIAAAVAVVALVVSRPIDDRGAPIDATTGSVVAQAPATSANQPYPPLSLPLLTFDPRKVMPASYEDLVLPNYYTPRGDVFFRNDPAVPQQPYMLYIAPQARMTGHGQAQQTAAAAQ